MPPFFCRERSKENADSAALTSSALVFLSLRLQGCLGWPSPAVPPNMRPRCVPSKGRKGLVPGATCAFCPRLKTAQPEGSNPGSLGPTGQTPGCPLHPLPLTADPHVGASSWPINHARGWTSRDVTCPGSQLTEFSFTLLGSTISIVQNRGWEKHFGQIAGRNLESDPHYPSAGSPVTPHPQLCEFSS